jgi:N-methylhydantoinase B
VNDSGNQLDPIQFEVLRNALLEVTEEMSATLRRSAYSTNIKTRADFSCAFYDGQLRVVAQSFAQATHLGSAVEVVPNAIREYGADNLNSGDIIVLNHPYIGGGHLNDFTLISPVVYMDKIVGYVANIAHHVDVGGGAPASIGAFTEVFQEGVIIPPVKLVKNGELVADIFQLILAQVRAKREVAGDTRAQIAANRAGIQRLTSLLDHFGLDTVESGIKQLLAYTEQRTKVELDKLVRGVFASEGWVDTDGYTDEPVHLVVSVVIDDDGVLFDLSGCDPQRKAPVNATYAMTFATCAYVLKSLTDPDVPINDGFYRSVRINAPLGTVVNCTHPYPVVGGWETQMRLTDIILKALAVALPERIPAGTEGMICHAGFGGEDPRTGEFYCFMETLAGGYGGRAHSDGPDAVQCHGKNTENAPIEETETSYPVRIARYELIENSEGPGRFRGGLGLRRDYLFVDHEVSFTVLADRNRWGPHGLFGGLPAPKASYVLVSDGHSEELSAKATRKLKVGDLVSYRTCGGGGYGSPLEREPSRVLTDVRESRVSLERARDVYGVVIDVERWAVDEKETATLRAASGSLPSP